MTCMMLLRCFFISFRFYLLDLQRVRSTRFYSLWRSLKVLYYIFAMQYLGKLTLLGTEFGTKKLVTHKRIVSWKNVQIKSRTQLKRCCLTYAHRDPALFEPNGFNCCLYTHTKKRDTGTRFSLFHPTIAIFDNKSAVGRPWKDGIPVEMAHTPRSFGTSVLISAK